MFCPMRRGWPEYPDRAPEQGPEQLPRIPGRVVAFPPGPDEGQPGLVLMPDGRTRYRNPNSDVLIVKRGPEADLDLESGA